MRPRILLVDDEAAMLTMLSSALADRYQVDVAVSGEEALFRLNQSEPFAVVIADMMMPGINGVELLAEFETRSPMTVRMMLTGDVKQQTAVNAVNEGRVFRFLPKPLSVVQLFEAVDAAVKHYDLALAEQQVLDSTLRSAINILLEIISTIDPRSFEISQRLRRTVRTFATEVNLPNVWQLELAAALARIGSGTLPTSVLCKLGAAMPLNIEEKTLLAGVPEIGWRLLKTIPRLEGVAEAVRFQAKHFDGHGVPRNVAIAGEEIPLGGRILKIFIDRAHFEMDGIAKTQAQRLMEERIGEYDPVLLEESFRCFPDYILQGVSADVEVQMRYASDLRPDQTVVTDIKTTDGLVIVAAGSRLTTMLIQRICNHLDVGLLKEPFCIQEMPSEDANDATEIPFETPTPLFRVIDGGQAAK